MNPGASGICGTPPTPCQYPQSHCQRHRGHASSHSHNIAGPISSRNTGFDQSDAWDFAQNAAQAQMLWTLNDTTPDSSLLHVFLQEGCVSSGPYPPQSTPLAAFFHASSSSTHPSTYTPYPLDTLAYMDSQPQFPFDPILPSYPLGDATNAGPRQCQWQSCKVVLDDLSHSGLRRHFRAYHSAPRGTLTRCIWGGSCRSEPMLFENIPKHIAECHLKSMTEQCPGCLGTFARKDTLKRHLNAGCPSGLPSIS